MKNPSSLSAIGMNRLERLASLAALVLLLLGCLLVMRPFVSAGIWAVVLSFSTWPVYGRLLILVRRRRTIAALLMTLLIAMVLLVPFLLIGFTMADNMKALTIAIRSWLSAGPPPPPEWLNAIPVVGHYIADYWLTLAGDSQKLLQQAQRLIEPASAWGLSLGLRLSRGVAELALSVLIVFFLFRDGAVVADRLKVGIGRLAGERGTRLLQIAGTTVRGVVYGILGTAIVQAVVAGLGFLIAGVPGAAVLTLLTFFLALLPMGPPFVWIPATIWLAQQGHGGWALFMGIWGLGVSSIDNLVRPWLISHGNRMPFLLIFFGMVGGALGFGFIGIFLGPTLLAIGYRLIEEWLTVHPPVPAPCAPTAREDY
jgi:predicted PurR-regulated permease PerM